MGEEQLDIECWPLGNGRFERRLRVPAWCTSSRPIGSQLLPQGSQVRKVPFVPGCRANRGFRALDTLICTGQPRIAPEHALYAPHQPALRSLAQFVLPDAEHFPALLPERPSHELIAVSISR